MNRTASLALLAGLLAALAPAVADADQIVYGTTTFTGQSTDFTAVRGGYLPLPYTDSYGNTINGGDYDALFTGLGVLSSPSGSGSTNTVTLNLSSLTTEIGFGFDAGGGSNSDYLSSATFSDGTFTDTFTGGAAYQPNSVPFMSFTDDRAFNQVTLTFTFGNIYNGESITGFTTAVSASVPEPSSLAMCGLAGLIGSVYAWRRRQRAATA